MNKTPIDRPQNQLQPTQSVSPVFPFITPDIGLNTHQFFQFCKNVHMIMMKPFSLVLIAWLMVEAHCYMERT